MPISEGVATVSRTTKGIASSVIQTTNDEVFGGKRKRTLTLEAASYMKFLSIPLPCGS